MKTFVLDGNVLMTQGCVIEDGKLLRCDIDTGEETQIAGNIYKGRVTFVNHQKHIGFIDIGLERNGMINFKDVTGDVQLIAGQDVLVQVISDPYGEKGAKLTTELSFQGKYIVLLTGSESIGVSRKIDTPEKKKFLVDKIKELIGDLPHVGAVIRTDAATANVDTLVEEFQLLKNQMEQMLGYRVLGNAPRLLREQKGLLDQYGKLFNSEKDQWITNDPKIYEYSVESLGKKNVQYYAGHDLFDYTGCKQTMDELRSYRLPLASGGELVIDYTEACTVIDVNSGKQKKNAPTHDVLFKINCEAMERTRWFLEKGNIAGAILIDLINVGNSQGRLIQAAKEIFKGSDCYIAGISALGFLEITRKRVTKPAHKIFEYHKPIDGSRYYEPNLLFYMNQFINEVRRLTIHHSGRHFKFLCSSDFKRTVELNKLVDTQGKFYENKDVEVTLIEDDSLKVPFKITY